MNPDLRSIADALNRLISVQQKGPWDYINTAAVVLTLIVLIVYTIETYRLRKAAQEQTAEAAKLLREAQRQNQVAVMPFLILTTEHGGPKDRHIVLKNVGSGPAYNLLIEAVNCGNRSFEAYQMGNVMGPGERQVLQFHIVISEGHGEFALTEETFSDWLYSGKLPNPLAVAFRYQSVLGQYESRFSFEKFQNRIGLTIRFERTETIAVPASPKD